MLNWEGLKLLHIQVRYQKLLFYRPDVLPALRSAVFRRDDGALPSTKRTFQDLANPR